MNAAPIKKKRKYEIEQCGFKANNEFVAGNFN